MFLCVPISLLSSCNEQYLEIPNKIVSNQVKNELFKKMNLCIIYYFDGDCSFCYSNILSIENSCSEDIPRIYICYGKDTLNINYNIENLNIGNIELFYDTNNLFRKHNKSLSKPIYVIDSTYRILNSAKLYNDKLNKQIQRRAKQSIQ